MAVESKRGCGFRQVGGLYMVAGKLSAPCDRLPFELSVCPCCGAGVKFTRGFTWIQPQKVFGGVHTVNQLVSECECFKSRGYMTERYCPACNPFDFFGNDGKAGLLWIGRQFYKTPEDFVREGAELGVSRRIQSIPHGFKVGETWIFVAHVDAVERLDKNGEGELFDAEMKKFPGIFAAFKPTRIERIVKQSEFDLFARVGKMIDSGEMGDATVDEVLTEDDAAIFKRLDSDVKRGITLIPVPDDDPDHNRKGK